MRAIGLSPFQTPGSGIPVPKNGNHATPVWGSKVPWASGITAVGVMPVHQTGETVHAILEPPMTNQGDQRDQKHLSGNPPIHPPHSSGVGPCPGLRLTPSALPRPEKDIANGLVIVRAVRGCKSVKPLIVVSSDRIGGRWEGVTQLANTLVKFVGDMDRTKACLQPLAPCPAPPSPSLSQGRWPRNAGQPLPHPPSDRPKCS